MGELVGTGDLVAVWEIHLSDGVHSVEFEHGTTSGKRVVRVDGKETIRHDWMFKLVGTETFKVGKSNATCVIKIDPVGGFAYQYSLMVNGKPYKTFVEQQNKIMRTWVLPVDGSMYRVVLEGTETHFTIANTPAFIRAESTGNRRKGIAQSSLSMTQRYPSTSST